jgi:dienelactone hydrolase
VGVEGFAEESFDGKQVFRRGDGPAVIVIHEVPGITPAVAAFGREVADAGMTAVLPSLFGTPGKPMSAGYALRSVVQGCVSREFTTWALGETSPVAGWLRGLARAEHERCGGPGVGAVGMCFTGGFALGMMVDPVVVAPAVSQPSLPWGIGRRRRASVGLSDADLAAVKQRAADGVCVMGLRYEGDPAVPDARFATLRRELGEQFVAVELPGRKHSVLTEHRDDGAAQQLLDFFRSRLLVT